MSLNSRDDSNRIWARAIETSLAALTIRKWQIKWGIQKRANVKQLDVDVLCVWLMLLHSLSVQITKSLHWPRCSTLIVTITSLLNLTGNCRSVPVHCLVCWCTTKIYEEKRQSELITSEITWFEQCVKFECIPKTWGVSLKCFNFLSCIQCYRRIPNDDFFKGNCMFHSIVKMLYWRP